jgi:hypothetical protein
MYKRNRRKVPAQSKQCVGEGCRVLADPGKKLCVGCWNLALSEERQTRNMFTPIDKRAVENYEPSKPSGALSISDLLKL